MARKKDIAGLAALGALGMMLKGKGEDAGPAYNRDTDTGVDAQPSFTKPSGSDSRDYGVDYSEAPQSSSTPARPAKKPVASANKRVAKPTSNPSTRSDPDAPDATSRQRQYEEAQAQANTPQAREERKAKAESQALGQIRPEEYVIGGPAGALKTVANMARGLAGRRGVEKAAEYSQPAIGYAERKLLGSNGERALLEGPAKRLTGPSAQKAPRSGEVAEGGREAVTNPMAWSGGPKSMREIQAMEDAARVRKGMSEMDTTGGAIGYKRGGMVKKPAKAMSNKPAKMSASSRGDGIAMRGKTRGMMR